MSCFHDDLAKRTPSYLPKNNQLTIALAARPCNDGAGGGVQQLVAHVQVEVVGVDVHEGLGHAVVGEEDEEDPVEDLGRGLQFQCGQGQDEHRHRRHQT